MNREDRQRAPARNTHRHSCGHFDACYVPNREPDCETCRRKKASARMRADYERSVAR